jgi:hypothetical protein
MFISDEKYNLENIFRSKTCLSNCALILHQICLHFHNCNDIKSCLHTDTVFYDICISTVNKHITRLICLSTLKLVQHLCQYCNALQQTYIVIMLPKPSAINTISVDVVV